MAITNNVPTAPYDPQGVHLTGNVGQQVRYDYVDATTAYLGVSKPGKAAGDAAWRISRITTSGDDVTVAFADGVDLYIKVWNDRASYTY